MAWISPAPESADWSHPDTARRILGDEPDRVPPAWAQTCLKRVIALRDELRGSWVGLRNDVSGELVDWVLAALLARENLLLVGPPGTAKTELAVRTYQLLGLTEPQSQLGAAGDKLLSQALGSAASPREWWSERDTHERQTQKYFHYLLSRFTQPEELFGPIEIDLLRRGHLVRVNFGLLTGPGVRAAFLDEVFKASSSILNTLLTLTNERVYPNWGGMVKSDLLMFIGASNEMPGGFGSGAAGIGSGGEDFQTLHAFLDRFPIRLNVPAASGTHAPDIDETDLAKAFDKAMERERKKFESGDSFGKRRREMASVNDVLLVGRYAVQSADGTGCFADENLAKFRAAFLRIAAELQTETTNPAQRRVTWTISPRKLKALYKIALAHALVRGGADLGRKIPLDVEDLAVFTLIWDTPLEEPKLREQIRSRAAALLKRG